MLRFLLPEVLSGIENTLIAFFRVAQGVLEHGQTAFGAGSFLLQAPSVNLP